MGLGTFLFQKKAWGRHNDCLVCENLSLSIHGCFVTFWKFIHSQAVTPRWWMMLKNSSNQGGANSTTLAPWHTKSRPQLLVALKAVFLENYLAVSTWILNGSSIECLEKKYQPFILVGVWFGSLVNQISRLKSPWRRSGLCLTLLLLLLQVNSKKQPA